MLNIKQVETNYFKVIRKSLIISRLKELGYETPLEEINDLIRNKLELNLEFNRGDRASTHMREYEYLRRNYILNTNCIWTTYVKLKDNNGFCIVSMEREEEKRQKETFGKLVISSITVSENVTEELEFIQDGFSEKIKGIEAWVETNKVSERFAELSENYTLPIFEEEDYSIAKKFANKNINQTIQAVKASGGMLRREVNVKTEKYGCTDELLEQLIDLKLIKSEYVILCRKSSEQINRVPSKESIGVLKEHNIKCRCGKLISDELIEEILTTTDKANYMVDGSHWMTIALVEAFLTLGVPKENILVNIYDGPEEIDAIVSYRGKLLLFELKDSQFSMGHAYAFQSRLGLYTPTKGIIWAAGGVAPEVKEHYNRAKSDAELYYIEKVEHLYEGLNALIQDINWEFVESILQPLHGASTFSFNIAGGILKELQGNLTLPKEGKQVKEVVSSLKE
ncbi:hypothetical protein [Priestia aryabhattai]|uniref:hypothetical protein n=1 Tax=Priestia aryabhattai TaxID=412384 RepID=UPI003D29DDA7